MNLYNNEDEKKDGVPVLAKGGAPFKKTSIFGRTPMISRAAGGIMDRIKNLSRRDLAFVGLGLSVLITAPVAEYLMSQPAADNKLTGGFGDRGKEGSSGLYEPGINALSQGSADGSGEVITPLSSRDPARFRGVEKTPMPHRRRRFSPVKKYRTGTSPLMALNYGLR